MSQKNIIHHELISGSGDACLPQNIVEQSRSSKRAAAKQTKLKKLVDLEKRSQLRRALTLNDMTPPHQRERLQKTSPKKIDKNEFVGKQLVMSKLLSNLYYKLWKKKKIQSDELKEQIKQLLIQKSFLNQMREKESKKRDELSKITEHLYKEIAECNGQILSLKEERNSLNVALHNTLNSFAEIRLELEESDYLKTKFQKNNNEHLEYMHRINEELAKLKMENKDQKQKILYMNNVADQQDYNLKQLHKIAEDLDVNLKENVDYARSAIRRRDEAIEKEEQATYRLKMLESCLKESKESERNLKLEINQMKYLVDESEKRKLLITLENVDLKYKLESMENSLHNSMAQIKQFEVEKAAAAAKSTKSIFCGIRRKIYAFVPWHCLLQLGIHFFPVIASSLTTSTL